MTATVARTPPIRLVARPLGAALRRYRSDLESLWTMADSWAGAWAERLDPAPPPPPPDNVVDIRERHLHHATRRR